MTRCCNLWNFLIYFTCKTIGKLKYFHYMIVFTCNCLSKTLLKNDTITPSREIVKFKYFYVSALILRSRLSFPYQRVEWSHLFHILSARPDTKQSNELFPGPDPWDLKKFCAADNKHFDDCVCVAFCDLFLCQPNSVWLLSRSSRECVKHL